MVLGNSPPGSPSDSNQESYSTSISTQRSPGTTYTQGPPPPPRSIPSSGGGFANLPLNTKKGDTRGTAGSGPVSIPREQRHKLEDKDFSSFLKECTEPGIVEIPDISDHSSVEDMYDNTLIVEKIRKHLEQKNLETCFYCVNPVLDAGGNTTGAIQSGTPIYLLTDHAKSTYQQIVKSLQWQAEWVANDTNHQWVKSDMRWSGEFLFNQMPHELEEKIQDDIVDNNVPYEFQRAGPIVFKALINRMLSSNYSAISLLRTHLQRDRINLEDYNGNIEDFCRKLNVVIAALRKSEIKDPLGNVVNPLVPQDLSESLLLTLKNAGHTDFDLVFQHQYSDCRTRGALGEVNPFPQPEEILRKARRLYVNYVTSGDWIKNQDRPRNPAGYNAQSKNKKTSKCFGCGRQGCRRTETTCPRFNKEPNGAGILAKQEFDAAKKARAEARKEKDKKKEQESSESKTTKWPDPPASRNEPATKIDGLWHWYHFKSKKWIKCKDQENPNQKSANVTFSEDTRRSNGFNGSISETTKLPPELANLAQGKDPAQVALQAKIYFSKIQNAAKEFGMNL